MSPPLLTSADLAALVRRAQGGDRAALQALLTAHQRLLYGTLMRQHPNHADCADLLQQTLVKVIEGLPSLREPAAFRGWALRIALNELHQLHRHRGPHDGPHMPPPHMRPHIGPPNMPPPRPMPP
jgi:DNA-directed RNA polymerase specialized sigma24 family protein